MSVCGHRIGYSYALAAFNSFLEGRLGGFGFRVCGAFQVPQNLFWFEMPNWRIPVGKVRVYGLVVKRVTCSALDLRLTRQVSLNIP